MISPLLTWKCIPGEENAFLRAMIQAFEKYEGRGQHQESQWASALYWCSAEKLRCISKQLTAKYEFQRASHSVKEDPYILEWKHCHRSKVMM